MIEQAIYGGQDRGGYRFLARSPGFREDWLAEAERLCTGFGERPAGVACPGCVFAQPFGRRHIAIVQAADQGHDDTGRPGALGFHLLILPRALYLDLGGDPFSIAEQFPPPWSARGELPALSWTAEAPPLRTAAMLRQTLEVPHCATLLGGVQVLLDGGRLVFERGQPDAALLRSLWRLLPTSTRSELWPATFAFGNAHRFHAVVTPKAAGPEFVHYLSEEQAADYPEGRYERNLELAVKSGDQAEIDALLSRRSRSQTVRLAVTLLVMAVALSIGMALLNPPRPARKTRTTSHAQPSLDLPPVEECRTLDVHERTQLAERLQELGKRRHIDLPRGTSDAALAAALAELDRHLGTPDARRNPGPLRAYGPLQRQLRALLWKHAIADYNNRGLNTVELLERLQQHLGIQGKD